jgi:hypothetical protein
MNSLDFLKKYAGDLQSAAKRKIESAAAEDGFDFGDIQVSDTTSDIGFGTTPAGKTILDENGSWAGFIPRIEKRSDGWYVEDRRGYGPNKGKMHKVSESMAEHTARRAAMGQLRYLMPHPNPEKFVKTITAGGLTGTMTPSVVTGGGTIRNPQFKFSDEVNARNYNEWAKAYQKSTGTWQDPDKGLYGTGVSGNERWQWTGDNIDSAPNVAVSPRTATAMGVPINRDLVAAYIARNRGQPTAMDYKRADRQIEGAMRSLNKKQTLQRRARY